MKQKGLIKALPFLILLCILSAAGIGLYSIELNKEALVISHESGIYGDSFDLSIHTFQKGTVLYTTDGHYPALDYANVQEYTEPIQLICGNETSVYSFQICCYYEDGSCSEVYSRDFILDAQGDERFTTTYVVSLTGSEDRLFGEEDGIFVRGNQFYEYLESHPDETFLGNAVPANYLEDVEVPVHVAFFNEDGMQIIDQNCGVKIYGNITRQHNQKSFRLYARYEYDDVNEFSYPFFSDLYSDKDGELIGQYQRLSFHNAGTDHDYGYIRTELVGKLARQSGLSDTLTAESVTVYINGKYQGVYWLQNVYDDRYFEEKYGEYNGEMVVATGTMDEVTVESEDGADAMAVAQDYNDFCTWIAEADLSDDSNWERVCNTIDIENFAHYVAVQYYTGNLDWPQNNVKVYRYVCDESEEYTSGTVYDGRYRYLLYDTDYSFGLFFLDNFGHHAWTTRLNDFINTNENMSVFQAVMARKEFRDLFNQYVFILMNVTFNSDNVSQTMYELNLTRYDELKYMIEETTFLQGSIWEKWNVGLGGMADTEAEWNEIVDYANVRPAVILDEMQNELGVGEAFLLSIGGKEEADMYLSGINVGSEFTGTWVQNVPIVLSYDLPKGMSVEGYIVNGSYVEGDVLTYLPSEVSEFANGITIEPVVNIEETEALTIRSYRVDGPQDYIVLENTGTIAIELSEYSITDDAGDAAKGHLPSGSLEPGQQFVIYGEKYSADMVSNSVQVPFSWNSEEKIYLFNQTEGLVDER